MRYLVLCGTLLLSSAALAQSAPQGDAKAGLAAFNKYGCYTCHGIWGQGTLRDGPHLHAAELGYEALKTQLRTPRYEMPAYTEVQMPDRAVADVYAYLISLPAAPDAKTIKQLR